jgi:Flp pilus assembly protein TadD
MRIEIACLTGLDGDPTLAQVIGIADAEFAALSKQAAGMVTAGNLVKAMELLEALAIINPLNASVWSSLGSMYLGGELFDDARQAFKMALRLDPDNQLVAQKLAALKR